MSNSRGFRRHLAMQLAALDGQHIPGGCPDCHAYQTVTPITEGAWEVTVHHDSWCPTFAAMAPTT
jgi:hypothetical protein